MQNLKRVGTFGQGSSWRGFVSDLKAKTGLDLSMHSGPQTKGGAMDRLRVKQGLLRLPMWHWERLAVLGLMAIGVAGCWWPAKAGEASDGIPRLVVDRTEVDLGDLPFEAPAKAVFTLTNTGDGVLKLAGEPQVKVLKGC